MQITFVQVVHAAVETYLDDVETKLYTGAEIGLSLSNKRPLSLQTLSPSSRTGSSLP